MDTIVAILERIFFQSMVPVGSRHVVAVLLVWFPPQGSWYLSGKWSKVRGLSSCWTVAAALGGSALLWAAGL